MIATTALGTPRPSAILLSVENLGFPVEVGEMVVLELLVTEGNETTGAEVVTELAGVDKDDVVNGDS